METPMLRRLDRLLPGYLLVSDYAQRGTYIEWKAGDFKFTIIPSNYSSWKIEVRFRLYALIDSALFNPDRLEYIVGLMKSRVYEVCNKALEALDGTRGDGPSRRDPDQSQN